MVCKYIKDCISNFKKFQMYVDQYSCYLVNGTYSLDVSCTKLYLHKDTMHRADTFKSKIHTSFLKRLLFSILSFFCNRYKVSDSNRDKLFQGELLLLGTSSLELKIFDIKARQVMTVFLSYDRKAEMMSKRNMIEGLVHIPDTVFENDSIYIERMIESSSYNHFQYFPRIIDMYMDRYQSEFIKKETIQNEKLNSYSFFKRIYEMIKCYENKMPYIICHGDLWSSNVLVESDKIYIIDYESVGYYSFLYDFFVYMYNEYMIYGNMELLTSYFKGVYDSNFSKFAKKFDFDYNIADREIYFLYFLYEFASHRYKEYTDVQLQKEIRVLKSLFSKAGLESGEL